MSLNTQVDAYQYFERVAAVVQEITKFDRVMIYRFDANWEGEVIAENRVILPIPIWGHVFRPAIFLPRHGDFIPVIWFARLQILKPNRFESCRR